jgi:hypothetical protein
MPNMFDGKETVGWRVDFGVLSCGSSIVWLRRGRTQHGLHPTADHAGVERYG